MHSLILQQTHQYFPTQRDFLIGLSGGVDSVVLLHLFAQQPHLNLRAVHIHHGLSPNADSWLAFCQQLCHRYNVPLISQKVHVQGDSGLEANARNARYQAISQLISPNEVFVTAHHLDDQVETFFLALKRGSGIKGLSAMQAVSNWQNFAIFRPLLSISKTSILHYAEQQKLQWINDESNADNRFDRNFLRNQILPELNQRWSHFSQMVARSAQHCTDQQTLIEELLTEELSRRIGENQQLDITNFAQFSPLKQQQLVRLWLEKNGITMPSTAQLQAVICEVIFALPDKIPEVKLGDKYIRRFRQAIFITEKISLSLFADIDIPPNSQRKQDWGEYQRTPTELICTIWGKTYRLSLPNELQLQPLTLKFGQTGKVYEYGKSHREEMKKIWQKNSVPPWERHRTPLIFCQEQLLFVLYDG